MFDFVQICRISASLEALPAHALARAKICAIRAICATKNFFRVRTHFTDSFPLFIR